MGSGTISVNINKFKKNKVKLQNAAGILVLGIFIVVRTASCTYQRSNQEAAIGDTLEFLIQ